MKKSKLDKLHDFLLYNVLMNLVITFTSDSIQINIYTKLNIRLNYSFLTPVPLTLHYVIHS
jgi:hypothetical protein